MGTTHYYVERKGNLSLSDESDCNLWDQFLKAMTTCTLIYYFFLIILPSSIESSGTVTNTAVIICKRLNCAVSL
jgi:hypothetical protein